MTARRPSAASRLRPLAVFLAGVVALASAATGVAGASGAGDPPGLRASADDHPAVPSGARADTRLGRPPQARGATRASTAALASPPPTLAPPFAREGAAPGLRPRLRPPALVSTRCSRGPPPATPHVHLVAVS